MKSLLIEQGRRIIVKVFSGGAEKGFHTGMVEIVSCWWRLSGRVANWVKAIESKNWLFWGGLVRAVGNARWKESGKKKYDDCI